MTHVTNPKPEPHKRVKARLKRLWQKARQRSREMRYERDGGCCVRCGRPLKLKPSDEGADWWNVANINEVRPRSLGGDPLNPDEQTTLCAACHTGSGRHVA